ncbi:MAG: DNA repair protein RadC [Candidatus Thiodiazotropha sp.]|nr:DNA repair protein RadC [Candidatus Thiodiazotropha sp.]MCM8885302.1 DNA repair protein RadC [Candidatus Thiodiazotropha sp.]MCM8921565.1 DNA repair protein RadC [Candidatus Thiodiazotropha sp.]
MANNEDQIIEQALQILESRMGYTTKGEAFTSPEDSKRYAKLQLAEHEQEVFAAMFLDNRHRLISFDKMFYGTVDGASVHPREVVKSALKHNAAAVIFAHNHPSGVAEPSQADQRITTRLKDTLTLVDVRVLDHLVVGDSVVSFAERGLL